MSCKDCVIQCQECEGYHKLDDIGISCGCYDKCPKLFKEKIMKEDTEYSKIIVECIRTKFINQSRKDACDPEIIHPSCNVCHRSSGSSFMRLCRECRTDRGNNVILCSNEECLEKHILTKKHLLQCQICGKYRHPNTIQLIESKKDV